MYWYTWNLNKYIQIIVVIIEVKIAIMCMMVKMIIKIVVIKALYMIVNWTMMLIALMTKKIFIQNIYTKYTKYVNDGNILEAEEELHDMNIIYGNKE